MTDDLNSFAELMRARELAQAAETVVDYTPDDCERGVFFAVTAEEPLPLLKEQPPEGTVWLVYHPEDHGLVNHLIAFIRGEKHEQ